MEYSEMVARVTELLSSEETVDIGELSTLILDMNGLHEIVVAERENAIESFEAEVIKNTKLQETNSEFMKRLVDKGTTEGQHEDEDVELSEDEIEELADEVIEEIAKEWMGE